MEVLDEDIRNIARKCPFHYSCMLCTLYNICEVHGEELCSSWIDEMASHTCELPQPEHSSHSEGSTVVTKAIVQSLQCLLVCHNKVWNLDHFLKSWLTRFWVSGVDCIIIWYWWATWRRKRWYGNALPLPIKFIKIFHKLISCCLSASFLHFHPFPFHINFYFLQTVYTLVLFSVVFLEIY